MIIHESNGDMRFSDSGEPEIELSAYVVAYLMLALLVLAATAACCGVVFLATV